MLRNVIIMDFFMVHRLWLPGDTATSGNTVLPVQEGNVGRAGERLGCAMATRGRRKASCPVPAIDLFWSFFTLRYESLAIAGVIR
jgi:hypothetical protein